MPQNNNQNLIWKNSTVLPITRQLWSVQTTSDTDHAFSAEDVFNTIFIRAPSGASTDEMPEASDVLGLIETPRPNDYFDFHIINISSNTIDLDLPSSYVDNLENNQVGANAVGKFRFTVSSDNKLEARSLFN